MSYNLRNYPPNAEKQKTMEDPNFITPNTNTTPPLPPTSTQPPMTTLSSEGSFTETPPNKIKQFLFHSKLRFLLIIPIIIFIAVLVFGYMIFAKGQTQLGEKLQDEIWKTVIDNANDESKSMELSVSYTDSGTYKFVPSKFTKPFNQEFYSEDDVATLDKTYSFTISDFKANFLLQSAFDVTNKDKPMLDTHIEGAVSNNSKSFEGSADLKLTETEAFQKYNYNSNVEDLINYLSGGYSSTPDKKNKWLQIKSEYELNNIRESVKLITQLEGFESESQDATRLADIRQLASALELYYNDNNAYPESINGKPVNLTETYLGVYPTAPTPPNGTCTEDLNNYYYEAKKDSSGQATNYSLTFCLGSETGGIKAGNNEMSSQGINEYNCPSSRKCSTTPSEENSEKTAEQTVFQKLLREHRLFDIEGLKGISMMDGTPVAHYELKLNKDKLRELISSILNEPSTEALGEETKDALLEITDEIITKINVNNYEVWVGVTNHKLYKSSMEIDALSITKTAEYFEKSLNDPENPITKGLDSSLDSSRSKARDAKRLADARQIASSLELYFNDNNSYPPADNGVPVGVVPTYIGTMPTAPEPDGQCSEYDNTYWYSRPSPTSYKFMFCLGENTGGINAGVVTLTEFGFDTNNVYTPTEPTSYNSTDDQAIFESLKSSVINTIRNLNFDAKINIEYSAKNIGKKIEVTPPKDFIPAVDVPTWVE